MRAKPKLMDSQGAMQSLYNNFVEKTKTISITKQNVSEKEFKDFYYGFRPIFEHYYWATDNNSSSFSVEIPLFSTSKSSQEEEVKEEKVTYEWFIENRSILKIDD